MKPEDTMTQVMAIITPLVTRGANIAQEVAARVLGNVVAERLHLDGHEEVLEDFQRNPHNDSLVRHLLLQAMNRNAEFRGGFDDAPQATPRERPRSPGSRRIDIAGAGQVQAQCHSA